MFLDASITTTLFAWFVGLCQAGMCIREQIDSILDEKFYNHVINVDKKSFQRPKLVLNMEIIILGP